MNTADFEITPTELLHLSGVPDTTLDQWGRSILNPTGGGRGRGHRRKYGLVDAVAVVNAGAIRAAGSTGDHVGEVVKNLATLTRDELEGAVKGGRVICVPALAGAALGALLPVPPTNGPHDAVVTAISVNAAYEKVIEYAKARDFYLDMRRQSDAARPQPAPPAKPAKPAAKHGTAKS